MYIVHEYLVEENVLTKTYLLANKIYCMYIPTAFSLWHREGPLTKASEVYRMTFNAVNHVNFLNNNKWQARATPGLFLYFVSDWLFDLSGCKGFLTLKDLSMPRMCAKGYTTWTIILDWISYMESGTSIMKSSNLKPYQPTNQLPFSRVLTIFILIDEQRKALMGFVG